MNILLDSSCNMVSQSGVEADITEYDSPQRPNLDACKQLCRSNTRCLAMVYEGGYCFLYDSTSTRAGNKDYHLKVCRDDQCKIYGFRFNSKITSVIKA